MQLSTRDVYMGRSGLTACSRVNGAFRDFENAVTRIVPHVTMSPIDIKNIDIPFFLNPGVLVGKAVEKSASQNCREKTTFYNNRLILSLYII
jgi:hypothetical protein